jgi:hypothetical protein
MKTHWKQKTKETSVNDKENQRKTKEIVEQQMNTNEKTQTPKKNTR